MGYYSNVCIAIKNDVELPLEVKNVLYGHFDKKSLDEVDYYINERIKWYSDVNFVEDFLYDLDEELFGFVRVGGGNADDIDTMGCCDDFDIYPYSCTISTPFE